MAFPLRSSRLVADLSFFQGSVFVEFASVDSVTRFMALDPKPTFEGHELEIMSKSVLSFPPRLGVLTYFRFRADYVEMKRKIYAPDSKPTVPSIPKNPYVKSNKPFNAWAEDLIGAQGFPGVVSTAPREDKKRKAAGQGEDGTEEREILFDGVRFTAKKSAAGDVEIVDEENVGRGEGGWPAGKVLRFVIAHSSGALDGPKEEGEPFNFAKLKTELLPICRPAFVALLPDSRPIAPLPSGASAPSAAMAVDTPASEFPVRLTAPPTIATASATPAPEAKPAKTSGNRGEYPAKGQVSFRDPVTDKILETIKSTLGLWEARKVEWVRASRQSIQFLVTLDLAC